MLAAVGSRAQALSDRRDSAWANSLGFACNLLLKHKNPKWILWSAAMGPKLFHSYMHKPLRNTCKQGPILQIPRKKVRADKGSSTAPTNSVCTYLNLQNTQNHGPCIFIVLGTLEVQPGAYLTSVLLGITIIINGSEPIIIGINRYQEVIACCALTGSGGAWNTTVGQLWGKSQPTVAFFL